MIMNCEQYTGPCVCGRVHTLETRKVVVAEKALAHFEEYMEELGLDKLRRTVVYDFRRQVPQGSDLCSPLFLSAHDGSHLFSDPHHMEGP